ncbi:MAG: hypothetical protein PHF87_09380 [Desulfotomaculaceae bacterium]|nr:hypothetical protein [Desulfotomaculaceae bacterium]
MKAYRHPTLKWALTLCLALVLGFTLTVAAQSAATSESTQIPTQAEAEKVLSNFSDATERRDVDDMIKYCVDSRGSVEDQKKLYKSLFVEEEPYPVSFKLDTIDKITLKNAGTLAVANATVSYSDKHTENVHLKFIKDKGEWKLYITSDK